MFFSNDDDFEKILKSVLKTQLKIDIIPTGWTNIVINIKTNGSDYIAKFPRDTFWSKKIVKDAKISNFIRNSLNINTANMGILYYNDKPFSLHKKIEGYSLTEKLKTLSKENMENITTKLAEIFTKFHNFDIKNLPDFCQEKYYDFIIGLPKLDENSYNYSLFNNMKNDEKIEKQTFIHGDLNIGNILLNKDNNVEAIIDYSFCGVGDIYTDLSIISCRVDSNFTEQIIKKYEQFNHIKLIQNKLIDRIELRRYIEEQYKLFMKNTHPEVVF